MISFACYYPVWADKSSGRTAFLGPGYEECFVVSSVPVLASPAVVKIVVDLPIVSALQFFHEFSALAYHDMSTRLE